VASLVEVWWYPHYAAPFLAALLILAAQSMRYLRQWKYGGREVGRFLVDAIPVAVLLLMIASQAEAIATHRTAADQIQAKHTQIGQKQSVEQQLLEEYPGQHVIFVSYAGLPITHDEWIYNPANVDDAPVIWALDLGWTENEKLRRYYAGRSFWLFKPAESLNLSLY
jgi:hypothetical protein